MKSFHGRRGTISNINVYQVNVNGHLSYVYLSIFYPQKLNTIEVIYFAQPSELDSLSDYLSILIITNKFDLYKNKLKNIQSMFEIDHGD